MSWKKHWYSQSEPSKYDDETRGAAPKWKYPKELKVASVNVRSLREIPKRGGNVTYEEIAPLFFVFTRDEDTKLQHRTKK